MTSSLDSLRDQVHCLARSYEDQDLAPAGAHWQRELGVLEFPKEALEGELFGVKKKRFI